MMNYRYCADRRHERSVYNCHAWCLGNIQITVMTIPKALQDSQKSPSARSLRSSQEGACAARVSIIHPLYLYSVMSDIILRSSSCGRWASAPTSQESWTACDGGWLTRKQKKKRAFCCSALIEICFHISIPSKYVSFGICWIFPRTTPGQEASHHFFNRERQPPAQAV
jgi:hypothetical protein